MKTKFIIISLLAIIAVLSSCTPTKSKAQKPDLDGYLTTLLHDYYPYSIDEDFVFINEDLDRKWEAKAYGRNNVFPDIYTYYLEDELCECYGGWSINIDAYMLENGVDAKADEISNVSLSIISETGFDVMIIWNVSIRLSDKELFTGFIRSASSPDDVLSHFADTIILPIQYQRVGMYSHDIETPEGAYARIVKNQGLTDFSVDGKTVWKRVK